MKKSILFIGFIISLFVGSTVVSAEHAYDVMYDDGTVYLFENLLDYGKEIAQETSFFEGNPVNSLVDAEPVTSDELTQSNSARIIIGEDNREIVTDTTISPFRQVVVVGITFPNGKTYRGSGVLISADTVLTAAHCIYDESNGGWAKSVAVEPGRNGLLRPFGSYKAKQLMTNRGFISQGDLRYDIAAIKLEGNIGDALGWFGLTKKIPETLTLTGYHGDYFYQQGTQTSADFYLDDKMAAYELDTYSGSSGSAVYNSDYQVFAVHSGSNAVSNGGVRMTEQTYLLSHYWAFSQTVPVRSLNIIQHPEAIRLGEEFQLIYQLLPADAENVNVLWYSSDSSIIEVSETGKITGKSPGKAVITVQSEDGMAEDQCEVTVSNEIFDDHGDSHDTATPLELGKVTTFRTDYYRDYDCFSFTAPEEGFYLTKVKTTKKINDQMVHLYLGDARNSFYSPDGTEAWTVGKYKKDETKVRAIYNAFSVYSLPETGTQGEIEVVKLSTDLDIEYPEELCVAIGDQALLAIGVSYAKELEQIELSYQSENEDILSIDSKGIVTGKGLGKGYVIITSKMYPDYKLRLPILITEDGKPDDHGDSHDTATPLELGKVTTFRTDYYRDYDCFSFTAPEEGFYLTKVKTTKKINDQMVHLYLGDARNSFYSPDGTEAWTVGKYKKDETKVRAIYNAFSVYSLPETGTQGEIEVTKLNNLEVEYTEQLTVSIDEQKALPLKITFDEKLQDAGLVYQSNNTKLLTVDEQGIVTGTGVGKAYITITSKKYPDWNMIIMVIIIEK